MLIFMFSNCINNANPTLIASLRSCTATSRWSPGATRVLMSSRVWSCSLAGEEMYYGFYTNITMEVS